MEQASKCAIRQHQRSRGSTEIKSFLACSFCCPAQTASPFKLLSLSWMLEMVHRTTGSMGLRIPAAETSVTNVDMISVDRISVKRILCCLQHLLRLFQSTPYLCPLGLTTVVSSIINNFIVPYQVLCISMHGMIRS